LVGGDGWRRREGQNSSEGRVEEGYKRIFPLSAPRLLLFLPRPVQAVHELDKNALSTLPPSLVVYVARIWLTSSSLVKVLPPIRFCRDERFERVGRSVRLLVVVRSHLRVA
jgi:hypothetical protein